MLSFELSAIDLILGIALIVLFALRMKEPTKHACMLRERLRLKPMLLVRFAHAKLRSILTLPYLVSLFLVVLGLATFTGVGWIVWYDVTSWDKGISLIFFGSRTGEAISLGIGMRIIHYFLIGSAFLLLGLPTFLARVRHGIVFNYINRVLPNLKKKLMITQKEKTGNKDAHISPEFHEKERDQKGSIQSREGQLKSEGGAGVPSTNFSRCSHHLGYFGKIGNDAPLPDECLGCLQIVECLGS